MEYKIYIAQYESSDPLRKPAKRLAVLLSHPLDELSRKKPKKDSVDNRKRLLRYVELDWMKLDWKTPENKK